ncbi:MAG TPA: hypothetical protein PK986_12315 [Spirochaetota bacterium]|nr:hypothetical protein [Spirochaetota bacterium]HQO41246.1 hypothetical protein [Spirochaetota bacterium]
MTGILRITALVFFIFSSALFAQVRDPDVPISPEVDRKLSSGHVFYSAEVSFKGGSVTGEIDFPVAGFKAGVSGTFYYWKDISSISITSWVRRARGERYLFYPESYQIAFKAGSKINIDGNIKELNRFRLVQKRRRRTMYTYYYDDYVKGAWALTGVQDFYSPALIPAEGCVVSIKFR